jgi:exo-beta-1,3-glucanase (GH17 family)
VLFGLNFSPYKDGQSPAQNIMIPEQQIRERLAVVAPYTRWVRAFSSRNGLERICPVAHEMGLNCAAQAWLDGSANDAAEISGLISLAQSGAADIAVVGSEAILRGQLKPAQIINYMNQVRAAAGGVPVTTADVYGNWLNNPSLISAADLLFVNYYPFWEGASVQEAIGWLHSAHRSVLRAAAGKPVYVSETGWPSLGNRIDRAEPSVANAATFFLQFVSWARSENVRYFYFSAFNEAWKSESGGVGPYWGIWDSVGVLKPGMRDVFDGKTLPDTWSSAEYPEGPGAPIIEITYGPVYGGTGTLRGRVSHVRPADYKLAVYIKVGVGWWTKPTFAVPLTSIRGDGTWSTAIHTGGSDETATRIAVFLVPTGTEPPAVGGAATLPNELNSMAVAVAEVLRTPASISGTIAPAGSWALPSIQVALTGTQNKTVVSEDGKYSFPDLVPGGTYTVTPSAPGISFTPTSRTLSNINDRQASDFTFTSATQTLSITTLTPQGAPQRGIPVRLNGVNSGSTDDYGRFSTSLPVGSPYIVTPWAHRFVFNPPSATGTLGSATTHGFTAYVSSRPTVFLQNASTGAISPWLLGGVSGTELLYAPVIGVPYPGWEVVAAGDFNQDGTPDILLQHDTTNQIAMWYLTGPHGTEIMAGPLAGSPVTDWKIACAADFDRNGTTDLVLQHSTSNSLSVWFMSGLEGRLLVASPTIATPLSGWKVTGCADFDYNTVPDIVLQNDSHLGVSIWYMGGATGTTLLSAPIIRYALSGWRVVGTAYVNDDNMPDLVLQNDTSNQVSVWFMGGVRGESLLYAPIIGVSYPNWRMLATK